MWAIDSPREMEEDKTVLVHVGARVRPIKFSGTKTDLTSAIKLNFSDVLSYDASFFIQVSRYIDHVYVVITTTAFSHRSETKIGGEYLLIYSLNKR